MSFPTLQDRSGSLETTGPAPPASPTFSADSTLVDRVVPADPCKVQKGGGGALAVRQPSAITHVVIHVLQGNYANAIENWRRGRNCYKAHYVISKTGEITQVVAERHVPAHANRANGYSVGIEHDGFATSPAAFTDAMYLRSAALVRDICRRYGIPTDRTRIIGHDEAPGTGHGDPGGYWDWDYYLALVGWDGTPARRPIRLVLDHTTLDAWPTADTWTVRSRAAVRHTPFPNHSWGPKYYAVAASRTAHEPMVYLPTISEAGTYELSAWWPVLAANCQDVGIRVLVDGSSTPSLSVRVNQASRSGRTRRTLALPSTPMWFGLGSLTLRAGANVWIEISRQSSRSGTVVGDAIRLLRR